MLHLLALSLSQFEVVFLQSIESQCLVLEFFLERSQWLVFVVLFELAFFVSCFLPLFDVDRLSFHLLIKLQHKGSHLLQGDLNDSFRLSD